MRRLLYYLGEILLISGLVCGVADANDLKGDIARCAQVSGDLRRLECFDELARTQASKKGAKPTATEAKSKWQVSIKSNPVDDSKTVALLLLSDTGRSRWGKPIALILRCMSDETTLYISWQSYLGGKASVLTRIGKAKAETGEWHLSTDSQASFYPEDPIPFIKA